MPSHQHSSKALPRVRAVVAGAVSWALPWLATLAVAVVIAGAMTISLSNTQEHLALAETTASAAKPPPSAGDCNERDNWLLVYAQTTRRVPATSCAPQASSYDW